MNEQTTASGKTYAEAGRDHLWMHFTRHSTYEPLERGGGGAKIPIITKGLGHKVWDDQGNE